ncbi:MAG: hypothetical protein NTY68_03850 [Candidatus Micrarchaeota archaeon]|nr:hypothetical protein [Candidatus Micrarchaeota archaeon]
MVSKSCFRPILLAFLLVSLSLAQAGINETSYNKIANEEKPYIFTVLLICISLLTIYMLYGYISKNEKEILNAKSELGQVLVTCVIILFAYVFMISINSMFTYEFKNHMNISIQNKININDISSTKDFNTKEFDYLFDQSRQTIENGYSRIVIYKTDAAVPTTLPRIIFADKAWLTVCSVMSAPFIFLGLGFGPGTFLDGLLSCGMTVSSFTTSLDAYKNTFASVLEMELNSIFSPLFNVMSFMLVIGKFFIDDVFIYFFLAGIILRLPPWTRKAGDLLILVSFVGYTIFPFLYAVFLGAVESVDIKGICNGIGSVASFEPFGDCDGETGVMVLGKYAIISSFVTSVILGLVLSLLNNFKKVFEMIE